MMRRLILLCISWIGIGQPVTAQIVDNPLNEQNYKQLIQQMPAFTIYGDNYFITGTSLGETPNENNSDAKFQLGFKQRLTNLILPWNTFLFFTYRQKSFWDIYRDSYPFRETNYNPGLGLAKLFFRDGQLHSGIWFQFEHESNGRDETFSRSWNYLSLLYIRPFLEDYQFRVKLFIPVGSLSDNPDIMDYRSHQSLGVLWQPWEKLIFEGEFNKATTWDWRGNLQIGINFKISKLSNQFIYLQYFQGYAEELLEYQQNRSKLRIGIAFKDLFSNQISTSNR